MNQYFKFSIHGRRCVIWVSHLVLFVALTGCAKEDMSDLTTYVAEVKAKPKRTIPPLPDIKVVEPYIFKPEGLRDPFKPMQRMNDSEEEIVTLAGGIRPDNTRHKEELESYSLDTLRMVGTFSMKSDLWGLVVAGDGTIHRIQVGNYMGKNHGKIIRIADDRIELMEIVPDKPGMWREQQASLALVE
jgi:type IV pilus assembly protein PilP